MKRVLSLLTAVAMLFTLLPALGLSAFATSDTAGDGINWTIDKDSILTVSGEGPMEDIDMDQWDSWIEKRIAESDNTDVSIDDIQAILVKGAITYVGQAAFAGSTGSTLVTMEEGVQIIGSHAFRENVSLTEVYIPASVTKIGDMAFYRCERLTDIFFAGSEDDWGQIEFGENNNKLLEATVHFGKASPFFPWGDADSDREITYLDAMLVLRHAVKLITLNERIQARCDVNNDGSIDYLDAMLILRKAVKLIDIFPVEVFDATDGSVPDQVADIFGFESDSIDADEDGLSNYHELFLVGTDPTLADTDGNGINDADEDADGDLLSNAREIELGTNPQKDDSDADNLSDYAEINEYGTDPCKADTDEDGLNDGDEIVLGLDPLVQYTDGTTLDSERIFSQELNEENISEALLAGNNEAVPMLTVDASGNANESVFIDESDINAFSDSRAIIGKAIDIYGSSFEEGTLSFELTDSVDTYSIGDAADEDFSPFLICKYGNDGKTDYLDTEYSGGVLSAQVDGAGTYYVLNVKNLFDELGLTLPSVSDPAPLSYPEPDADRDTGASSNVKAQADIVFIIDTTGSMEDEIFNVKNNIADFVDVLNQKGISAALALIDYEDITVDGYDSTRVHKNGTSNWFYNVETYKAAISNLSLGYGGDTPECVVDALETARLLDMRASAGKIFILVTDADYKVANRYDIPSMDAEIELLKNAQVNCSVVSPYYEQSTYYDLYTETGGVWADIYGDFYEELMVLADKIGDEIVGDGYWIYLDGPVPVPVRLDAMPTEGSTVDTDRDGISDIEELEGATPSGYIDLDALVTKVSRGVITGTNYGMVMMYKYSSSPVEEDSDFDGISDKEEPVEERLSSHFTAKMNYKTGDTYYNGNIDFTVDYRYLFEDNTKFNQNLAVLASVYVLDMYDDGWIELTGEGSGNSKSVNGVSLGKLFGLEGINIDAGTLLSDYSTRDSSGQIVDTNDVSEVYIGHKLVTYRGEKREVFFLMIRGTNGTQAEWSSNFDVGADASVYYDRTGEHPDWTDKANHKGFDVAKTRILKAFNEYVSSLEASGKIDPNVERSIFIAGHSRGAAIANLVGAYFEDHEDYSSYVYTMACPYSTTHKDAASYSTIFNITNSDDLVTYLPLESWGFKKYGEVLTISAGEYEDRSPVGNKEGTFEALFDKDYDDNAYLDTAVSSFKKLVDTSGGSNAIRKRLYELDTSSGDGVVIDGWINLDSKNYDEFMAMLKAGQLDKLCKVEKVDAWPGYKIKVTYCPAYVMQIIADLAIAKEEYKTDPKLEGYTQFDWLSIDLKGKYSTARRDFVTTSGKFPGVGGIPGGMECPHMPGTYYLISKNTAYDSYIQD